MCLEFSHLLEHNDLISIHDGGQPVSDEHRRSFLDHLLHGGQDVLVAERQKLKSSTNLKTHWHWRKKNVIKQYQSNVDECITYRGTDLVFDQINRI